MANIGSTIKAKSDQLNAGDLIGGGVTVTVKSASLGGRDQPLSIELQEDYQTFKPCLSMRRVLAKIWGLESDDWIGKQMTLYCDPSVKWAGKEEGGIRISHMEGVKVTVPVTVRKNKRETMTYNIEALAPKAKAPVAKQEPVISAEQFAILSPLATCAGENGATVWTQTACDVMTENNIPNIDKLPASKFDLVKKQLEANNV